MIALILGLIALIIFWIIEYHGHHYYRKMIPTIIHVNGTRGKSSVTRLIAAGLREGGKKTLAKTTGSAASFIFENGSETRIVRYFGANIKEQLKIIRYVAKRKVDALVLECMAVNPEYQWVTEHKMVNADVCVITNSRMDHLDEMGPGIRNITLSLCNTFPKKGVAFTAEKKMFPLMKKEAQKKNVRLTRADENEVSDEEMRGFYYIEHKENVALALQVCEFCGIDRKTAIHGMWKAIPDIGATEIFRHKVKNKEIYFAHSFAANDPESTKVLIENIRNLYSNIESVMVVLNTRADRLIRSKQLIEMLKDVSSERIILVGQETKSIKTYALTLGFDKDLVHDLGWVEGDVLVNDVIQTKANDVLLFGIGNIGGNGGILVEYFKARNSKNV
jgi:poly-gamma-glutamate synthase PgsB/CapB